tara:strand:- start:8284 stop:9684 length:1401 start_codon:yes stop_codon:yes gene_type:complete
MHLPAALRVDSNLPTTSTTGNQALGSSTGRGDNGGNAFSAELNGELKARQHNASRDDRHQNSVDQHRADQKKADQGKSQNKVDQDRTDQQRLQHDKSQRSRDNSRENIRDNTQDSQQGNGRAEEITVADGNSGRKLPNKGGELPPEGDVANNLAVQHINDSDVDVARGAGVTNAASSAEDSLSGAEMEAAVAGAFNSLIAGLNAAQAGGTGKDAARMGGKLAKASQSVPLTGRAAAPVLIPALEKAAFINSANHDAIRAHLETVATGRAESSLASLNTAVQDVATPVSHASSGQAGQPLQAEGGKPLTESLLLSRPTFTLPAQAGTPGWDAELGDRVRWLLGRGNPLAELRLNPAQLGSVEVRIVNDGERTNVTFFAAHPHARELLESALPRLQQMFEQHGLDLAGADVSAYPDGRAQDAGDGQQGGADGSSAMSDPSVSEGGVSDQQWLTEQGYITSLGAIDYYV